MKCNQCNMMQITLGKASQACHEHGCPNTHKVWNEEDQEWVTPEPEDDFDEDWERFEEEAEETERHDPSDRYGHYEGLEDVQRQYGEI